jgi:hypothetical protein
MQSLVSNPNKNGMERKERRERGRKGGREEGRKEGRKVRAPMNASLLTRTIKD